MGDREEAQLTLLMNAEPERSEERTRVVWEAKPSTVDGFRPFAPEKPLQNKASPAVPSWNQILTSLREMDLLRQAQAA
jgi:hypothetical protein